MEHPYGNDRLYLCKTILEAIQSPITIDSTLESGTTFTFTVVAMPSLVVNLNMNILQNSLFPQVSNRPTPSREVEQAQFPGEDIS